MSRGGRGVDFVTIDGDRDEIIRIMTGTAPEGAYGNPVADRRRLRLEAVVYPVSS